MRNMEPILLWIWIRTATPAGEAVEKSFGPFNLVREACCDCGSCCSDYFIAYSNWCRSSVFYYSDYHFICYFLVYQEKSLIKRELPLGAFF